jgi:AbrB family looped-hinge helix DNA binding protein
VQIKVSSKGQVVLPLVARNKYHIKTGDTLQFLMKEDQMTLVPKKPKKRKGRIVIDPKTGMAAVTFGPGAPVITSEWVAKMLEDFP